MHYEVAIRPFLKLKSVLLNQAFYVRPERVGRLNMIPQNIMA
jgi:hypothetical protein